jgi:hypothetical protein
MIRCHTPYGKPVVKSVGLNVVVVAILFRNLLHTTPKAIPAHNNPVGAQGLKDAYVKNCVIMSASQQGIDIWEIRRAVNMKELPSQDIDDWSFVFSRSRNR